MADTGKRIEVRCGAFACRVEGFDDPVGQLREVLSLMQRTISETPALADHASGLDDAQLARIRHALQDRRANGESGAPGIVVVGGGDRGGDHVADAEILPDEPGADGRARPPIEGPPAEAAVDDVSHPSAAILAAPAAAAEAAFAAGIAADDDVAADEGQAQGPLDDELPEEPATAAGPFAAAATGLTGTAFSGGAAAAPADPDDDAGDPDLAHADEAADERVPSAAGESAQVIAFGEPGEGWTQRQAGSYAAASAEAPPLRSGRGSVEDWPEPAAGETDASTLRQLREPAAEFEGADEADPLPPINIFAPPPDDTPTPLAAGRDGAADIFAAPGPQPSAALRREPGLAAAGPGDAPDASSDRQDHPPRTHEAFLTDDGDPDEVLDDGDGDWRDEAEETDAGSPGSAENRLAALITRYQSGLRGAAGHDLAPEPAVAGALSAAELAQRAEATDVADLLAVSAAWLTFGGGRARFTRREVMEVFETLPGDHPRTLEARIKGFGKIVRSGTLQLIDEGIFALAPRERARFRAMLAQG